MTQAVTEWAWKNSRASGASLIVLLAIAHEADKDGNTEMSVQQLAAKCRLGERTVQVALAALGSLGELDVTLGGGRGRLSRYQMIMSNPAESAPIPPSNPAESAPFRETPQNLHPAESAPFKPHRRRSRRNPADPAPNGISDVFIEPTGTSEVQVKDVPANGSRSDVERLCGHLADRIEANGCKRPVIGAKWRTAARLMLDRDGHTEKQVHAAIDWCQDSEFWRANILSMPKLREKYDQLRLQASRPKASGHPSTTNDRVRQAAEAGRRVQAMFQGDS